MVLVRAVFQFWIASGFAYESGLNYRILSQKRAFHGNAFFFFGLFGNNRGLPKNDTP